MGSENNLQKLIDKAKSGESFKDIPSKTKNKSYETSSSGKQTITEGVNHDTFEKKKGE